MRQFGPLLLINNNMVSFSQLQIIACLVSVVVLLLVGKKLPLTQLLQDRKHQHLLFGSTVSITILWMFQASVPAANSPSIHFLWLAALPLILGFRWAVFSASLALLVITLLGKEQLAMLGVNFLLGVLAPISLTYAIYSLTFHKLPRHLFTYIFLCAFIPGALTISLKMLTMTGYFYVDGVYDWPTLKNQYLVITWLMLFPEAMFNGMTITLLVLNKPQWVYTYQDKYYLNGKAE